MAEFDLEKWAKDRGKIDLAAVRKFLLGTGRTIDEISSKFEVPAGVALDMCQEIKKQGALLECFGDRWIISKQLPPTEDSYRLTSDKDGCYRFGVISDTHYGSLHAREDVCDMLYDWFEEEGITRVFHAGNWIEGEARFNKHELMPGAHGMQAQLDYFVAKYPQRKGVTTFYVGGDDHEGWYVQREGVDIGRMLEDTAHRAGRHDLVNMGYMEAYITLERKGTGNTAKMWLVHPGGGSSYALSYAPQKMIEALQPGEKPAVAIFGHWHKLEVANIRGVWSLQAGCTKDLDAFGRKRRLQYHIGGLIVTLKQDKDGAIYECVPNIRQFWDRGYYNHQFEGMSGPKKVRAPRGRKKNAKGR